jgi:RNA polymerase sigma-70 factor (ECF subfamily)
MDQSQYFEQWSSKEQILDKYDKYKTMLYRIAFSYLGNKQDCEDILQDVFIKLCYSAPEFPSDEDEKRWLIRVTINRSKDHLKSFWQRNKICLDDIEDYVTTLEDREDLLEIINLPPKYKVVIHLYYYEGYNIMEISNILKASVSAVKMRLKRGRELLKIELEDYYESW